MLPPLGDGAPHLVQAEVELLDHVSVAVPDVGGPGQEEVVGWLPHALKGWDRGWREEELFDFICCLSLKRFYAVLPTLYRYCMRLDAGVLETTGTTYQQRQLRYFKALSPDCCNLRQIAVFL